MVQGNPQPNQLTMNDYWNDPPEPPEPPEWLASDRGGWDPDIYTD